MFKVYQIKHSMTLKKQKKGDLKPKSNDNGKGSE